MHVCRDRGKHNGYMVLRYDCNMEGKMIIKRRGYKSKGLTFEEFISKNYLAVVVTGVREDGGLYFKATVEHWGGAGYYISNASGTKTRDLMGSGPTEAMAIKELAWKCQMQYIAVRYNLVGCIKVPTLRIN